MTCSMRAPGWSARSARGEGGKMVIRADLPAAQQLILVEKDRHGRVTTRETLPVRFWQLEGGEPG